MRVLAGLGEQGPDHAGDGLHGGRLRDGRLLDGDPDILHSIRALLQAIRDRDPEAADRAMAEHMRMASARLRASVDG